MIMCLMRAIRFGRLMHPFEAREWIFPADSANGHLAEQKEDREEKLASWLGQGATQRTIRCAVEACKKREIAAT